MLKDKISAYTREWAIEILSFARIKAEPTQQARPDEESIEGQRPRSSQNQGNKCREI